MTLQKYLIETGLEFKDFFSGQTESEDGFTQHIHHSIPSYGEMEELTAEAIVKMYSKAKILDIGASEGTWGKKISKDSNGSIITHNLDPNSSMKDTFDRNPVKGAVFVHRAFGDGFVDGGEEIKGYKPVDRYDVVRESMTFQFISTDRSDQYRMCKDALVRGGLFITNSKNFLSDQDEYAYFEKVKDEYKRKYFSQEEIDKKAKEVLPNMSKYMTDIITTVESLEEHFQYVVQYWVSGNFHGFVASDDKTIVDKFLSHMPEVDGFPNSVEGKVVNSEIIWNLKK